MIQSRQLAAIMFTDIVGYTAMMGDDEAKAFEVLHRNRDLQKPIINRYHGRLIKEMGDGMLSTFPTVTDAVLCAAAIQETCRQMPDLKLRIGIHQGEVVFEDDDVFGDGVNIASRIQAIASPGAIYVSESARNNIANNKQIRVRFVKEENLKNVKEPVKVYEILSERLTTRSGFNGNSASGEGAKSVAVLPFVNMSNDPEQDYFCDGISEEIINTLAQLDNLRVIARTSAFAFKGKNLDVREMGKALNAGTLLEGSVRKSGNHLRITTKLVKVADGTHLWSNRYDRVLEDVFAIQENIAENVATALQGVLTRKEKEAIRRPETIVEAYDCFLKGRQLFHQLALNEAKVFFNKAIELDAGYAPAYAGLADASAWLYQWEGSDPSDLEAAEINSRKALQLAPNLPESHSSRGFVLSLARRFDDAEQEFEEAIRLNINSYDAYYYYARSCFSLGQIERSAELFRKASEVRQDDYQSMLLYAQSLRILGRSDADEKSAEGINRARKQLELDPTDRRALSLTSGSLYEIGHKDEAFAWANKALELYPTDAGVLINAACLYGKDGNKEKTLELLETAIGRRFGNKDWIEHDPDYDCVRNEPRFQALMARLR